MVSPYLQIVKPRLLIGEGVEEKRFFASVLACLGITDMQVEEYGGKDGLRRFLQTLPSIPGYRSLISLGVTRDADKSVTDTRRSVCDALRSAGLEILYSGAGGEVRSPRISVFILPDDARAGMLEDLCLQSVSDDGAMACVDEFLRCVNQRTNRRPSNEAKARVHAWLSSQAIPDKRLGEAAEAGYWRFEHPSLDALKHFMRSL